MAGLSLSSSSSSSLRAASPFPAFFAPRLRLPAPARVRAAPLRSSLPLPSVAASASASAAAAVALDQDQGQTVHLSRESSAELLACPVCFKPLIRKGPSGNNLTAISRSAFKCPNCTKAFSSRDVYLDLTIAAGTKNYEEVKSMGTELFRSPFVSFIYERGWRQNFESSGFPGPDEEAKLAQNFLQPAVGGVLLDVSCGSGLFSRRFAKTNLFSTVVASDFSENMLRQCYQFIKADKDFDKANLALIRADVERLPFATGTIDAVHAGAALHCWPSPLSGVAEISRILRPGGVFVATTFLFPGNGLQIDALKPFEKAFRRATSSPTLRFWFEEELEELCLVCGLTDYKKIRRNGFIMLSASKPST